MAVAEVGGDGVIVIAPHPDLALWRLPVAWGTTEEVEAKVRRWAKLDPDGTRRVPGWRPDGRGDGILPGDADNLEALARFRDLCALPI